MIEKIAGENSDNALLESIRQIFREEVQALELTAHPSTSIASVKTELTEEQKTENAKSVLGDLDMLIEPQPQNYGSKRHLYSKNCATLAQNRLATMLPSITDEELFFLPENGRKDKYDEKKTNRCGIPRMVILPSHNTGPPESRKTFWGKEKQRNECIFVLARKQTIWSLLRRVSYCSKQGTCISSSNSK